MPRIDALSEVILYADDMDELYGFYTDVLGLPHEDGAIEHGFVRLDAGACDLCLHSGGDTEPDASAPKLVFEVDDLQAAREELHSHDVELGDIRSPAPGIEVLDALDPEGNRFALETSTEN